jgi:hypothetical protein
LTSYILYISKNKIYILKKFNDENLLNIYNQITNKEKLTFNNINELNGIKIGDFILFEKNGKDYNGEINNIIETNYVILDKNKQNIYISFDQIIEHYPKNIKFNKTNEDFLKQQNINDDLVVIMPDNTPKNEINNFINDNTKYFIIKKTKTSNELHISRIKDNGFDIKPFVKNLINHLLKKKLLKENISNMKLVGNNNFCIISNISPKFINLLVKMIKNLLK